MNLRNRFRNHPEPHTGVLNDILFILLLFFLIVSTLANPNVIKVSNPKAASDTKAKQTVVVTIDKDQHLFIGSTPVALVINGDSVANLGVTIQVMQIIKQLGATPVVAVDPAH